jgi:hypothetical protein
MSFGIGYRARGLYLARAAARARAAAQRAETSPRRRGGAEAERAEVRSPRAGVTHRGSLTPAPSH